MSPPTPKTNSRKRLSARRISKKSSNRDTSSVFVAVSSDTASHFTCNDRFILSAVRESLLHSDGSSIRGGRTSNWHRPAFSRKHAFRRGKKKTPDPVPVTMLTPEIIYPFRGDVNSRVSPSCPVDGDGEASEALKTDARINERKPREFTQHQQRRDGIVIHPRIGADVKLSQRPPQADQVADPRSETN